jgi:hypothetical protein
MERLSVTLLSKSTGRNVLIAFALMALSGASFGVLTPIYRNVAGFEPFDMQFPLTKESMIIQFGAFGDGVFAAYLPFAAVDMFFPIFGAAFTVLLWGWLATRSGAAFLSAAYRGGWWIWGAFPAVCDLWENVLFLRLLSAYPRLLPDAIDTAVAVHRGKLVLLSIAQGITAALIVVTLALLLRRRLARR